MSASLRARVGAGLRELDRRIDDALCLGIEPRPLLFAERESRAEVLDRVACLLQLSEVVLVAVDLRIADVVAGQALRLAEQEDRAVTGARVRERLERGEVDGLDVLPVHMRRAHPVRRGPLRQVLDRLVL